MTDHVLGLSKKVPVSKVLHVASSSEMARYYHLDTAFPAEQGPHKAGETISDKTSISAIMNDIEPKNESLSQITLFEPAGIVVVWWH